jgi:hypothetical protein
MPTASRKSKSVYMNELERRMVSCEGRPNAELGVQSAESSKDQGRQHAVPPRGWFLTQVVDFPRIASGKMFFGPEDDELDHKLRNVGFSPLRCRPPSRF